MEDLPKIPYLREKLKHLSEEEVREEEGRLYELCLLLERMNKEHKLTCKSKKIQ